MPYLRHILELGNGLGIRNEGESGAALHHAADVRDARLAGQIAQNAEGNATGYNGRARVHDGNDDNVTRKGERKRNEFRECA